MGCSGVVIHTALIVTAVVVCILVACITIRVAPAITIATSTVTVTSMLAVVGILNML